MKPKPLVELNHFTVPVALLASAIAVITEMLRVEIRVGAGTALKERRLTTPCAGRTDKLTAVRRAESMLLLG